MLETNGAQRFHALFSFSFFFFMDILGIHQKLVLLGINSTLSR
jgi:hypothetical protein